MGVITDKKNKPFNPRGNDQSPLAFNKAAIYSGKALDFDGVNDVVTTTYTSGFTGAQEFTYCAYINTDNTAPTQAIVHGNETVGWGLQSLWIENNKILFYAGTGSASTSQVASETLEPNKWYFIVGTHTPTENKIYLNGVLNGTATAANLTAAPQAIKVGAYANASLPFNGEITNVKVFNTALTPAQIADLYNFPENIVPTGVANTALKLWLPMQEGAGTTAYNGAPDALGSEVVTNGDFATDSNWTKGTGWTISGGKANASSATSDLIQSISFTLGKTYRLTYTISNYSAGSVRTFIGAYVAGITRNSNGTFTDLLTPTNASSNSLLYIVGLSGFVGSIDNVSVQEASRFGTISGATYVNGIGAPVAQTAVINWNKASDGTNEVLIPQGLTSGRDLLGNLFTNVRKQSALNLDGNSWAEVHDNESLDFGTGDLTMECWSKATYENTGSGLNVFMSLGGDLTSVNSSAIGTTSTSFAFYLGGSPTLISGYTTGQWYHIVGVRNGSNIYIYINGSLKNSKAQAGTITNVHGKQIGRDGSSDRIYKDQIAQPRIYNRALTAEEIQRNYDAGKNIYTN